MKGETLAGWLFLLTAVLFMIATLLPVYRGRPMNVTFVAAGALALIIAIAMAARARGSSDGNRGPSN